MNRWAQYGKLVFTNTSSKSFLTNAPKMRITKLDVRNYRTIEDITLSFPSYYSAICGRNNAGKTTLVRAIRAVLPEDSVFVYSDDMEVSFKDDFPAWKKKDKTEESITISLGLLVNRERDTGLFLFISKFAEIANDQNDLEVMLQVIRTANSTDDSTSVSVNGKVLEDFSASEIAKKIRSSTAIFFYNSTELDQNPRLRHRRGFGGLLGEFSTADRAQFEQVQKKVDGFVQGLAKKHQKEVGALLGKLEEKYNVGFTLPKLNLEYMPIDISLGSKNFAVPLNDWGSGTRNRTQVLLTILKAKQASQSENVSDRITPVLIIEEPESFLHPSAQAEFGRVIQDLAEELEVQVIATTHSPYMLSLGNPGANVLLQRCVVKKDAQHTQVVDTCGDSWMEPFGLALGLDNIEFEPWRNLLNNKGNNILLVEGDIDKEYFELLRDPAHGTNRLEFDGEIVPYGGKDTLKNVTLLKFILSKYNRFFLTFDLDAERDVRRPLDILGLERTKQYLPIGVDAAGRKDIEGLVPEEIRKAVHNANFDLAQAAMSADPHERNEAKAKLKRLLLEHFKTHSTPGDAHFAGFYKIMTPIRKALSS